MRWFWFLCLTIGAVSDLRERTVSCRVLAVCGGVGMVYALITGPVGHIRGLAAGMGLLLVSRVTGGAVGMGDGWFLLASAWYLTGEEIWLLLLGGLSVSWFWSAGIILRGNWIGKNTANATLPFLACMWPIGAWILMAKGGLP